MTLSAAHLTAALATADDGIAGPVGLGDITYLTRGRWRVSSQEGVAHEEPSDLPDHLVEQRKSRDSEDYDLSGFRFSSFIFRPRNAWDFPISNDNFNI
ncbi:hypothetical protein I308_102974 [Cryptococcus tetragattii IND107]|uniref:Uncharacterized protein n=1 Tax=Cryptococcus tetragattii IND107 TaxID=1296105 RepID=A0ABR3BUY8_9TREE